MSVAMPDGREIEQMLEDGELDVRAEPAQWQREIAGSEGTIAVWLNVDGDDGPRLGCGLIDVMDGERFVKVRPLRHARTDIPLTMLVGALDNGHEMRQLLFVDGGRIDDCVSLLNHDRSWVIQSEPLVTKFASHRWTSKKKTSDDHNEIPS